MRIILNIFLITVLYLVSCSKSKDETTKQGKQDKQDKQENKSKMEFKLTSSAFENGSSVPGKYTCDGDDISPPLKWNGTDDGIKSFALIMDDPDAPSGDFVHWVIYNIPSSVTELQENFSSSKSSNANYTQGINDFGKLYYRGPCPPSGTHRYYFKLYALDIMLDIKAGASKKELLNAMNGHVKAQTELMGKYQR